MRLFHKFFLNSLVEHLNQRIIILLCIENDYGLSMQSQLLPRYYLKQFFECSATTRKSNESISHLCHLLLSFMNVFSNYNFRKRIVTPSPINHKVRYNTNHLTSSSNTTVRNSPHKSSSASTAYTSFTLSGN